MKTCRLFRGGLFPPARSLFLTLVLGALILGSFLPSPAAAQSDDPPSSPALCPPGVDPGWDMECSPLGPIQYLNEMAEVGISFPLTPLPFAKPDPDLTEIKYQYAYVHTEKAPVYGSLDDAINSNSKGLVRRLRKGFNYISYTDVGYGKGKQFYYTKYGWVSSAYVTPVDIPTFQGVLFSETPDNSFGWILTHFIPGDQLETKRTPGFSDDDYTGHFLNHLDIVKVYDVKKVGQWTWYMIAPNEWVFQTNISIVTPNPVPPEGHDWSRWIEVNLYEQTIAVYDNREMVFATLISTGSDPYFTYPGTFQIFEKLDATNMRGAFEEDKSDAYYLENVPWTMYFDGSRALHGAYWRPLLGFPQSHGCVNLSVGDSRWLYDWAELGDWVYVWDPSGETPTEE